MGFRLEDIEHLLTPDQKAEVAAGRRKKRMFNNTPTTYNGVRFDSRGEAGRAATLDLMQQAGEVRWWLDHVRFRLGCAEVTFVVDFLVVMADGSIRCEDYKGIETEKFKFIKKLWRKHGPVPLHVIRDGKVVEIVEGGR